jgi:glycosyltransferase involved in cell wall biosynthesis
VVPDTKGVMRIVMNALSARQGGGQTYVSNLLESLPEQLDTEVFVLAPDSLPLPRGKSNLQRIPVTWLVENPYVRAVWEKLCLAPLLKRLGADVLFCPGGIVGTRVPAGCKTVTMFRNMIPFSPQQRRRYGASTMRIRNWLLERAMTRSMAEADCVIFISEFARRVVENRVPRLPGKTVVIPHGVNPVFRNNQEPRPQWAPAENYILYVSILDVYKAQLEVVRAFALLKARRPTTEKLILAGPDRSPYGRAVQDEINRLGLRNDVLLTGPVAHDALPSLYRNALINIFASECENCPNIMLEALASGRPLMASSREPMPEFGGDAAVYFDPCSPQELAEKLATIIDDPVRLTELSRKALQRSLLYDGSKAAQRTWELIQERV